MRVRQYIVHVANGTRVGATHVANGTRVSRVVVFRMSGQHANACRANTFFFLLCMHACMRSLILSLMNNSLCISDNKPLANMLFTVQATFGFTATDINECEQGGHNCDVNAQCNNTVGGFECHCDDGFTGNGTHCDGK